jgi:aspartyl/asparaginyl beta-hydroxylase (cupin superfamily)
MSDIKTLKMYAKSKKLPQAVKLGTVALDWLDHAQTIATSAPNTNEQALNQRIEQNITGTEIVNYDQLTEFYNQRYINSIELPSEINMLQGVHHLRFGVLEEGKTIPFHLDEPYTLRFVCMIVGSHKFKFETGSEYLMKKGELWFINGSYKHSVENTFSGTRIALLGKFEHCEYNTRIINELL